MSLTLSVKVFTVTFDHFNASLLKINTNLFQNLTESKLLNSSALVITVPNTQTQTKKLLFATANPNTTTKTTNTNKQSQHNQVLHMLLE